MSPFQNIADRITTHFEEVLAQFGNVTEQDPWIHLPADYRLNNLRQVLPLAVELALVRPADGALCKRMIECAAQHGEIRLEQGLPDATIFQEFYLAREAIWNYMRKSRTEHAGLEAEAIIRIDMALSIVSKASLRGYHRPTFETQGEWPRAIDQLATEWVPPPPVEELAAELEETSRAPAGGWPGE